MNTTAIQDDEGTRVILESSRFWIQRVLVPVLVLIGFSGNIVTVIVLTRRRMRSSTNIYLTALAVADMAYLLFSLLLSFSQYPNIHKKKFELYWRFYGLSHWLCDAASNSSAWLTVSFTLERYIAVCHPIKGKVLCTENRAKSIIIIVTLFCVLTAVVTAFEYQLARTDLCMNYCNATELNVTRIHLRSKEKHNPKPIFQIKQKNGSLNMFTANFPSIVINNCSNSSTPLIYVPFYARFNSSSINNLSEKSNQNNEENNETKEETNRGDYFITSFSESEETKIVDNVTCCQISYSIGTEPTSLGENEIYQNAQAWFSAIIFGLVPLALIIIFNMFLIQAVYASQNQRKLMTGTQENILLTNENRITLMLIGVVILYLSCQIPTATYLIYTASYAKSITDPRSRNITLIAGNICNFLIALNASTNFLLYCVFSKKYRSTFHKIFFNRRKPRSDALASGSSERQTHRLLGTSNGIRRNISAYCPTPRNLETLSLTTMPRSKSLMTRPLGKAKSSDIVL